MKWYRDVLIKARGIFEEKIRRNECVKREGEEERERETETEREQVSRIRTGGFAKISFQRFREFFLRDISQWYFDWQHSFERLETVSKFRSLLLSSLNDAHGNQSILCDGLKCNFRSILVRFVPLPKNSLTCGHWNPRNLHGLKFVGCDRHASYCPPWNDLPSQEFFDNDLSLMENFLYR